MLELNVLVNFWPLSFKTDPLSNFKKSEKMSEETEKDLFYLDDVLESAKKSVEPVQPRKSGRSRKTVVPYQTEKPRKISKSRKTVKLQMKGKSQSQLSVRSKSGRLRRGISRKISQTTQILRCTTM